MSKNFEIFLRSVATRTIDKVQEKLSEAQAKDIIEIFIKEGILSLTDEVKKELNKASKKPKRKSKAKPRRKK